MDTISDVLARLKCDRGQWEATVHIPCWPEPLEVWMTSEEAGPTPYQQSVLELILNHPTDLKSKLTAPLFESCREFAGETFLAIDGECNFTPCTFPELTEPSQIWDWLGKPVVDIEDQSDTDDVEFDFIFSCKWDMEHYLRVTFSNFQVADIH
jgi:hypothetical protein